MVTPQRPRRFLSSIVIDVARADSVILVVAGVIVVIVVIVLLVAISIVVVEFWNQ